MKNNVTDEIYQPRSGLPARVMGILNVTPDSFSDGGQFNHIDAALKQTELMLQQGATIIDVGGQSTRPGANSISLDLELQRVIKVIEGIQQHFDCYISIDTDKAQVMEAAINAGADMVNDVNALRGDGCLEVISRLKVPVCLMHMQGKPRTMQQAPQYDDVVHDVIDFFKERITACVEAGISQEAICIDPGFGFGKTVSQNYQLLDKLHEFHQLNLPLLVGISRKSMIGAILNNDVDERLIGSVSCATIALLKGARIIRVHDVQPSYEAVKIVSACTQAHLLKG